MMDKAKNDQGRNDQRNNWIAAIATVLLFLSIGVGIYQQQSARGFLADLDSVRHSREQLLSEKLRLDKAMAGLLARAEELEGENSAHNGRADQWRKEVKELQDKVVVLGNKAAKWKASEKELADLRAMQNELNVLLRIANDRSAQLALENERLERELKQRNDEFALLAQAGVGVNNGLVETVKGGKQEKLTIHAKRTRKIQMTFDLPEEAAHQVSFSVSDPKGKVYANEHPAISVIRYHDENGTLASLTLVEGGLGRTERVRFAFTPEERLTPGVYRIEVRSAGMYLGTTQVKLR